MNKADLTKDVNRAAHAKRLMDDSLLIEIFGKIRGDCHKAIETSSFKQLEEREEAYKMIRALAAFESKLRLLLEGGTVAESKLARLKMKIKG